MMTFKLAVGFLEKLAKLYFKTVGERVEELNPISDELLVAPNDLAPYFVEPDVQQHNPADDQEEEEVEDFRVPAFTYLDVSRKGLTALLLSEKMAPARSMWGCKWVVRI